METGRSDRCQYELRSVNEQAEQAPQWGPAEMAGVSPACKNMTGIEVTMPQWVPATGDRCHALEGKRPTFVILPQWRPALKAGVRAAPSRIPIPFGRRKWGPAVPTGVSAAAVATITSQDIQPQWGPAIPTGVRGRAVRTSSARRGRNRDRPWRPVSDRGVSDHLRRSPAAMGTGANGRCQRIAR